MKRLPRWITVALLAFQGSCGEGDGPPELGESSRAVVMATFYMSPTGSDANSGTSTSRIKSLWRAEQLVKGKLPLTGDINILIAAGTYLGQATYWDVNLSSSTYKVYIKSETGTRPVFQGCNTVTCGCTTPGCSTDIKAIQSTGTATSDTSYWNRFLSVSLPSGSKSNLVVDNIQVKNYMNGIQFSGGGSNTVQNCSFYKIGDGWGPTSSGGVGYSILWTYGYAAIHTKLSANNTFGPNNSFSINWNKDSTCPGCVHGIYLAEASSNNVITASTFDTISGDPVRIRGGVSSEGGSNNNLVQAGTGTLSFTRTGLPTVDGAAVSLWEDVGECRSWTNNVNNAITAGTMNCGSLQAKFEYACNSCNQCTAGTYTINSGGTTSGSGCTCQAAGTTTTATYLCCSNTSTGGVCN